MMPKILILTDNNPLSKDHCSMLVDQEIKVELNGFAQSRDLFSNYNMVISMACHSETDPFDFSALEIVFQEKYAGLPEVKFIFLSHLNFSDHFQYYTRYITPTKNELLDEEKCRFLNLPVSKEEIVKTVKELLKK